MIKNRRNRINQIESISDNNQKTISTKEDINTIEYQQNIV